MINKSHSPPSPVELTHPGNKRETLVPVQVSAGGGRVNVPPLFS